MTVTNQLLLLDVRRLRNTFHAWYTNPKEARRVAFVVLGIGFFLWWNVLRYVANRPERFLEYWPVIRYVFPVLFGVITAGTGGYTRVSRWLARWASGSWSVLPVEPRFISQWLLSAMLLVDAGWVLVALALTVGLTVVAGLPWWREFPLLLAATMLLVAMAAVAKIFAALLLRLTNPRVLLWQNWILRALGGLIAAALVQPLSALWLLAEYARHAGHPALAALALGLLALAVTGLSLMARHLVRRYWSEIAASFEIQQTTRRVDDSVPLAAFVARRMRAPAARFFALYNLRSGIELRRFGQPVTVGGRRLYMLLAIAVVALLLVAFAGYGASRDQQPAVAALFGALWSSMLAAAFVPPLGPVYRMMRILPVSFKEWLLAAVTLPMFVACALGAVCCAAMAVGRAPEIYRWYGVVAGVIVATVPLRVLVVSAFPDAAQTGEFIYLLAVALGALAYWALSWIAVPPVMLTVNIYFYLKASRSWRHREEGLSG